MSASIAPAEISSVYTCVEKTNCLSDLYYMSRLAQLTCVRLLLPLGCLGVLTICPSPQF